MKETRELVIIGAGPAGMSAAITASASGADVLVLDRRESPGGQIYRNVESAETTNAETLYRPPDAYRLAELPDQIICRCEEVTAGAVREQIRLGATEPNAIKSYLRCGMGPCQGRYCGLTLSEIIATDTGKPMSEVGYFRIRPPVKPVPINDILVLSTGELPAEVKLPDPLKQESNDA